ncbi:MAG: hypothetical protein GX617_00840 [Lentisphaerae bacterium]|nr:hypothetical protein [Lentisphaerota bacterium]
MISKHVFRLTVIGQLCVGAAFLNAASSPASALVKCHQVDCLDGKVTVSRVSQTLFADDFSGDSGKWLPFTNFENLLTFSYGELDGVKALIITKDAPKPTDTAFELTSEPFPVTGGAAFTYIITARGDTDMSRARGHNVSYHNRIQWRDQDQQILAEMPYAFKNAPDRPTSTVITGTIPAKAAHAVIRIGADSPNIVAGCYFALTGVTFSSQQPNSPYHPEGYVVSKPFPLPLTGPLAWDADSPAGAAVTLQFASAPDDGGSPGLWSDWSAPITKQPGARLPDWPPTARWVRYRATLKTADGQSPVLKSVTLGSVTDRNWLGQDITPPTILRLTPSLTTDPTAPIAFRLVDDSGVDWKNLRLFHHGNDIMPHCQRSGDVITFTPPAALEPPGFEMHVRYWTRSNFRDALTFTAPPDVPDALRVSRKKNVEDTSFSLTSPSCPVVAGESYTFHCDCRRLLKRSASGALAIGKIIWQDAAGASLEPPMPILHSGQPGEWSTIQLSMIAPAGAASAVVRFGFDYPNLGGDDYLDIRNVALTGPRGTPSESPEPNLHTFQIIAADLAGNRAQAERHVLIDEPPTQNIVSLRDDGFVLVDGKPFFPIGAYAVCKRECNNNSLDQAFADLKKAGFNFAHTYSSTRNANFQEFLDAAVKHGFKVWVASDAGANSTQVGNYLRTVAREYKHPAILAWYLADDTSGHVSPEDLTELHQAIRDLDPNHLTVQADGVGRPDTPNYLPYVHATDAFLPEIYPIHDADSDGPAKVISDMQLVHANLASAGNPVKSIWAIIQYFQGWTSWKRFPTFAELRAMSFLAIIHGAHGITWYTYGGFDKNHGMADTPETWNNMATVATQLSQLSDVLTEPTPPQLEPPTIGSGPATDSLGHPAISALLKFHRGNAYLFVASSAREPIRASFRLDARLAGKATAKVLFENRSAAVQNGFLADDFKPYDVHIYQFQ